MLVPAPPIEYNTRSSAGMVLLKVLTANIGFNQLFKYWGLALPGKWNVLSTLKNTQIAFAKIHFGMFFNILISLFLQNIGGLLLLHLHIYDSCCEVINSITSVLLYFKKMQLSPLLARIFPGLKLLLINYCLHNHTSWSLKYVPSSFTTYQWWSMIGTLSLYSL